MTFDYAAFPRAGANPRVVTTPTNPYHVDDHNGYADALNEIKTKYNAFTTAPKAWFNFNGISVPWQVATNDVLYVSGMLTLGSGGTDMAATGTWAPTAVDSVGTGTVNATVRGNWTRLAAFTAYVKIWVKVTSAWSGVSSLQVPLPTGWQQDVDEQILPGYCNHAGAVFGIEYPLLGVVHSKVTGGTLNGEDANPAFIRFFAPS